ncbi:DNA methyltransferase [Vibrio splendidus]|uniref:DNA methyltransferase n=2 Tax=Vibrio TaxID=662 RepID=UPI000C867EC4|nr:DNA methyltransferase [Vibrio splendidus]
MLAKLKEQDWDFKDTRQSKGLHSIHPYPAKFIPQIPSQIIDTLGCPEGAILDPFCGSGTTLCVAQSKGYRSIGVDLNPIACLISRVKTTPLSDDFVDAYHDVMQIASGLEVDINEISDIPNINHWFKQDIQIEVLKLKTAIGKYADDTVLFDALRAALSSIIVKVSNQDSDTRYAAVDKNLPPQKVLSLFESACNSLRQNLVGLDDRVSSTVINKDILKTKRDDIGDSVGLLVTSPPYPNAYEYWLYHKYRMWWLDFDPQSVKKSEIGARAHFFKKNHHTAEDFFHQMKGTLSLASEVLVDSGYAAFVVGRSKIHGEIVDNAQLIIDGAEELGFNIIGRFDRNMNSSRKSFNLSHANIKKETIVVVQK